MCKIVGFLLLGIGMVACAPLGRDAQKIGTQLHAQTVSFDRRVRNWFDAQDIEGDDPPSAPQTAYCYKTLGEISCYKHPVPGAQGRLVGVQKAKPMFKDYHYPAPDKKPEAPLPSQAKMAAETTPILPAPQSVGVRELHGETKPIATFTPSSAKSSTPKEISLLLSH